MHFSGWSYRFDEFIDRQSHRLIKQWCRDSLQPPRLFNRLDVRDFKGKWLEANVIEIIEPRKEGEKLRARVHFKGWTKKWDEYIDID